MNVKLCRAVSERLPLVMVIRTRGRPLKYVVCEKAPAVNKLQFGVGVEVGVKVGVNVKVGVGVSVTVGVRLGVSVSVGAGVLVATVGMFNGNGVLTARVARKFSTIPWR